MTPEIAMWIAGVATPAILGFYIWVATKLRKISEDTNVLVVMHRSPDSHGFGTGDLKTILARLTIAVEGLTHFTRWLAEQTTGKTPPPFIPEIDRD